MVQAVRFHLLRRPLRQGLQPRWQSGSRSLQQGCCSGTAAEVDARSQQLGALGFDIALPLPEGGRLHRPQSHVVGREEHAIQAAADGLAVAGDHDQIGAGVVHGHQGQAAHAGRGTDQAGGQAGAGLGQLNRLAALAVEEATGVAALQANQADGGAPAAGSAHA